MVPCLFRTALKLVSPMLPGVSVPAEAAPLKAASGSATAVPTGKEARRKEAAHASSQPAKKSTKGKKT